MLALSTVMCLLCHCPISKAFARLFLQFRMCFVTRNAKLSKFINNENFCKKEKKEIDRSRDVTGMVDNMHSNLTHYRNVISDAFPVLA